LIETLQQQDKNGIQGRCSIMP